MALFIVSFGINGIGIKRGFLRGSYERYPLTTVNFIFFKAVILGREAAGLHLDAMFGLADSSKWLIENYHGVKATLKAKRAEAWDDARAGTAREVERLRDISERAEERATKAESENYALRKVIKICSK